MNVTLQLRYCPAPQRTAAAWLIPGAGAAEWLAEVCEWSVPLADARFVVLPQAGALVWLAQKEAPRAPGQAYGRIAERVFLPVEAAIDPPLADRELAALLPADDALYVWHPRLGLVRHEPPSVLRVADLVLPPSVSRRRWDAAQPGTAINQRLLSIEPTQRPTLEDLIEAARGDIGSQPLAGGKLPSHPGEPIGGAIGQAVTQASLTAAAAAAGAMGAAAAAVAAGIQGLASVLDAGGTGTGGFGAQSYREAHASRSPRAPQSTGDSWLTRLANWAKEQQQAAASNLDRLRNRQIERLLHLLQDSPDLGLKFAIPFGGGGEFRGLARPGASLVERNIDFSLARLGGGGPADFWNLPESYRRRLLDQYRALASREIALGRHRRAAYIFAELLGDLTTAAATLAAGGHYREAAVLYQQRLKQPLAAARCLAQGGLWAEAIAIFEELQQWETVGELYLKLDQPEAAAGALRKAVMVRLSANDFLGAADLMEHKLHVPDEAQQTLLAGWPNTPQARSCLDASFELLGRHRWHDLAGRQVAALVPTARGGQIPVLAAALARAAGRYPADDVRSLAAEATRGLVSERLPTAAVAESRELLSALASLVPGDKLLGRDCDRYQGQRENERRRLGPRSRPSGRPQLYVERSFALRPAEWRTAVCAGDGFYAAGWLKGHFLLVRCLWDGTVQLPMTRPFTAPAALWRRPILLAADPRGSGTLYPYVAEGVPPAPLTFTHAAGFEQALNAMPHPGCDSRTRVLSYGPGNTVLVGHFVVEGGADLALVLTPYERERPLPGVQGIRFVLEDLPDLDYIEREPLPFFCRAADYYLGIGRRLIHKRVRQTTCEVPSPIVRIAGSSPHSRPMTVLGCEEGGTILWGDTADAPQTTFAADLVEPVVGVNRGGWLIAATNDTVEVFSTQDNQLNFLASIAGPASRPLAVLPTDNAHHFAIVTETGNVLIYEVPPRTS